MKIKTIKIVFEYEDGKREVKQKFESGKQYRDFLREAGKSLLKK